MALGVLALVPAATAARAEPLELAALTPVVDGDPGMPPTASELDCLALNIYWEARSEPRLGQIAVATVTLNRVADPAFPATVCGVVRQGEQRGRHLCQFSWHCDGLDDRPRNPSAWQHARRVAGLALSGHVPDPTGGALWFHSIRVHPDWIGEMSRIRSIGSHVFYRLASTTAAPAPMVEPPDLAPPAAARISGEPGGTTVVDAPTVASPLGASLAAAPMALAEGGTGCGDDGSSVPEPPDLAIALAASSEEGFRSLVEQLRQRADRPPCQEEVVADAQAPKLMLVSRLPEDAEAFGAILPAGARLADRGAANAAPGWLGGPWDSISGRGGALTPRDSRSDRAPVPVVTAEAEPAPRPATAPVAAPEPRAVPADEVQGPDRGLLAASFEIAQAAIPRLPALAPTQLLRVFEPPTAPDRLPPRPF